MRSQNWSWLSERSERSERAKRSEPEALKLHTRQTLKLHTRQARKLHTRQATSGSDMKLQVGQRSRQGRQWDQPQDPPTPPPSLIVASYRSPWDQRSTCSHGHNPRLSSRSPPEPPWDPQTSPQTSPDLPGPQKDPSRTPEDPLETSNIKNYQTLMLYSSVIISYQKNAFYRLTAQNSNPTRPLME